MKIAFFTPALKTSAIGRMASRVVAELTRSGHIVSVVRTEDLSLLERAAHDFGVKLIPWNEAETIHQLIQDADFVVHQIGNNFPFHRGSLEWLSWAPGVICLHDFYLADLFLGWANGRSLEADRVLERWYGEDASSTFFSAAANGNLIEEVHKSMPMTEWACAMATGVITHSHWGVPRVKKACAGPVEVVPLAYSIEGTANFELESDNAGRSTAVDILTVGHVNPNKRASRVIEALGSSSPLRARCRYQVVGLIESDFTHELAALARNAGVRLRIHGEVDSWVLARKFRSADVVCCLRWPSLEAASASAIEAMMHGKAIIVTDTGFYSELPDDCVVKVDPSDEVANLRSALERLAFDQDYRRKLGARAREWSVNVFTAKNYAEQLIGMGEMAATAAPLVGAVRHFEAVLANWGGKGIDMEELVRPLQFFQN